MKTEKRRGAKVPANDYTRANLRLDADCYRRLLVASVMENRSAGEIVSRLIEEHLRRWSMPGDLSARGKSSARDVVSDRQDGASEISLAVSEAA